MKQTFSFFSLPGSQLQSRFTSHSQPSVYVKTTDVFCGFERKTKCVKALSTRFNETHQTTFRHRYPINR